MTRRQPKKIVYPKPAEGVICCRLQQLVAKEQLANQRPQGRSIGSHQKAREGLRRPVSV